MSRELDLSRLAWIKANSMADDNGRVDSHGHSHAYYYQTTVLENLTDTEIILGMISAYDKPACNAVHSKITEDSLPTDQCRYFRYSSGGADHFNMRWFHEWCQQNRPHILKRLDKLKNIKAFW